MNEHWPEVTVLIPARPGQTEVKAVAAAKKLSYPREKLEILVLRGKQPSVQRNAGMRAARGKLIYFLDDDSVAGPENLARIVKHFEDARVKLVGGPNVCPGDAPWLETVFALVLGCWLAFGPSRARYSAVGKLRPTSEKELILCNLIALREPLLELGGFNEALYPNEENALMDEMQKRGGILLYDPAFVVERRPRANLRSFAKMLQTYGRGRAEQWRVNPTFGSALNFVPPLFCVYLLAIPLLMLTPLGIKFVGATLAAYLAAVLIQVLVISPRAGVARSIATAPLILLTHILYGLGFWKGLFTSLKPRNSATTPVEIERVSLE